LVEHGTRYYDGARSSGGWPSLCLLHHWGTAGQGDKRAAMFALAAFYQTGCWKSLRPASANCPV
jgi:hypothetical protein